MLFLANELNELQTERLIDFTTTFILYGCFMKGFNFEELALLKPYLEFGNDFFELPQHYMLKFFISSFLLLSIGVA